MSSAIPDPIPGQQSLDGRTPEQIAMERAAQKVSDVLLGWNEPANVSSKTPTSPATTSA